MPQGEATGPGQPNSGTVHSPVAAPPGPLWICTAVHIHEPLIQKAGPSLLVHPLGSLGDNQ